MDVEDARSGSNVRVDCLRMKRWADGAWMDKHQSEWAQWLAGRKLALPQPASYISYRYGMDRGPWSWWTPGWCRTFAPTNAQQP